MLLTGLRRALILALSAAVVAACAPGASNTGTSTNLKGSTVKLITVWSGSELDSFKAVLQPFEQKTGINVEIESTRDIDAILTTRVAAGDPPDLAAAPGPALLTRLAQQGKVQDLSKWLDMGQFKSDYSQTWVELGTVNGKLVQVFSWAAVKGFVWYNPQVWKSKGFEKPKTFDDLTKLQSQMSSTGVQPWCMAVESGAASGWAGSDFHKEIVLSQSGPSVYDNWWSGKTKWSSPEIKQAWQTFGQVLGANDSNVYGGANFIVNTNFGDVGNPMFASPPKCYMLNQASFITDFFTKANPNLKPGQDFDFFPLPDVNSKYAGAHVGAADAWSAFKDTPATRELIKYLITPEAQSIWVKRGGKLSPNKRTSLSDYPDDLTRSIAKILVDTKILRYDAGDLMPADMKAAYWSGILDFIKDQSKLDSILANLDKVQSTAYTS
jgi:alpha-glucoside transport system substrate-binding protein